MKKSKPQRDNEKQHFALNLENGALDIWVAENSNGATLGRSLSLRGLFVEQIHHFSDNKGIRAFIEVDEYFSRYPEYFNTVWRAASRTLSIVHAKVSARNDR